MNGAMFARPKFARSVARFILLGVLLPNVVYLGHWGEAGATHEPAHETQEAGTDEHDLHCHTGPSRCSGPQATVGSLNVNEDSGLITPEGTITPALEAPAVIAPEPPYARILQPPQAA